MDSGDSGCRTACRRDRTCRHAQHDALERARHRMLVEGTQQKDPRWRLQPDQRANGNHNEEQGAPDDQRHQTERAPERSKQRPTITTGSADKPQNPRQHKSASFQRLPLLAQGGRRAQRHRDVRCRRQPAVDRVRRHPARQQFLPDDFGRRRGVIRPLVAGKELLGIKGARPLLQRRLARS